MSANLPSRGGPATPRYRVLIVGGGAGALELAIER
jgi:hypothetical protein